MVATTAREEEGERCGREGAEGQMWMVVVLDWAVHVLSGGEEGNKGVRNEGGGVS